MVRNDYINTSALLGGLQSSKLWRDYKRLAEVSQARYNAKAYYKDIMGVYK